VLAILRRQAVTQDMQLFIAVQGYLKNLVDEIVIRGKPVRKVRAARRDPFRQVRSGR
jgi:hypothetical protein